MAYTLVSDTTFTGAGGAVATPGALGTLYDGWIDESGTFSISAGGVLSSSYTGSLSAITAGVLYRPATEKALNQQVVVRFTHASGVFPNIALAFNRATGNPPFTSCEVFGLNSATTNFNWGRYNATLGAFSGVNSGNGTNFSALTVGNTYDLVVQLTQTSSSSTGRTISGSIYTVTNPVSDALMSGTQAGVFSLGSTITTPGLNFVDCVTGVFFSTGAIPSSGTTAPTNGAGAVNGIILRIATYNDAGGIPLVSQEMSGLTFTGPATGTVGTASANFTVTPNSITFAFSTVVTPNDGGKGGTFTPASLTFAAASVTAQTFTYTPATNNAGVAIPINITTAASNPSSVMPAAVPITVSGSYTLTGPASGLVSAASTNFTVTPTGTGFAAITIVTPSAGGGGGTFTPASLTFAATTLTPQTFTYTPASAGVKTISTTNNQSLSDAPSLTYTAANAATTYTLTGPSTGFTTVASGNFTATPSGIVGSTTIVTPSAGAGGGTFSPTSVTFASGSITAQTFTYTAASVGAKTISTTNNQGLTDPASLTYTASVQTGGAILPTNAAFLFSPYNWHGLGTQRSDNTGTPAYIETCQSGSWFEFTWTASASPTATIDFPARTVSNYFTAFVNGSRIANKVTVPSGAYTLTGITASATNTLKFFIAGSTQSNGWITGTNTVRIPSITIDASSSPGTARSLKPWAWIIGDSITEGIYAGSSSGNDNLSEWSFLLGQALNAMGYDYSISAFGSNGWRNLGWGGDVPALYLVTGGAYNATNSGSSSSRWHLVANGISGLDSNGHLSAQGGTGTEPFAVLNFMATNDQADFTAVSSDLNTAIRGNGTTIPGFWNAIRTAAPSAWMLQFSTFCSYNPAVTGAGAAIRTLYTALAADRAGDARFAYLDTGSQLTYTLTGNTDGTTGGGNGVYLASGQGSHPNTAGAALIAPAVAALFFKAISAVNRWQHF